MMLLRRTKFAFSRVNYARLRPLGAFYTRGTMKSSSTFTYFFLSHPQLKGGDGQCVKLDVLSTVLVLVRVH